MKISLRLAYLLLLLSLFSCKVYQQDLMFQVGENDSLQEAVEKVESNYKLQPDDWVRISLFTNDGEQLIDPNYETINQSTTSLQQQQRRDQFLYLIQYDGIAKLPLVGDVSLAGKTIDEAEEELELRYNEFYKGSFVKLQFQNKRVVVLGAQNVVIPLENENMNLLEVLALAGGIQFGAKAQNIKILRGNLNDPVVFRVNLNEIGSMKNSLVPVLPGDVIYIEPWRRQWQTTLADITPLLSIASSVITIIFLFQRF